MDNRTSPKSQDDPAVTCRQLWLTICKNAVGRLSKKYWRNPDGSTGVDPTTNLWDGSFEVVAFDATDLRETLVEVGARIDALKSDEAIVTGVPKDGRLEGTITTVDNFKKEPDGDAIPRALSHFGAPPSGDYGLILFDGDGTDALPVILTGLYPDFAKVAVLVRPSASASVKDPQTGKPLKTAEHCYAVIDAPERAAECLKAVLRLAWIKGQGSILLTANGVMLPRGPVDVSVGSLERLVYEGEVVVGAGIERLPRTSVVGGGTGVLVAAALLAYADEAAPPETFNALFEAEKLRDPARIAESEKRKAAYREDRVVKEMAQGKTRSEAEAAVDHADANSYIKDGQTYVELTGGHVLYIDGKPVTISEIQNDPQAYHGRACADPMEPGYKSKKCAIIYTNSGEIIIPSFAHASAFTYWVPLPWLDLSIALGPVWKLLAAANDNKYSLILKTYEIEQLARLSQLEYEQRRKQAAKALGMRVGALDKMVGVARAREPKREVEQLIALLNAEHALVLAGNKAAVMKFDTPTRFRLLQVGALKQWFSNSLIVVGTKAVSLGDYWLGHKERRQYAGIEFAPGETAVQSGFYNLWQGFSVEPKQGDCSKFLAHLKNNAAQGDDAAYLWIVGWWAQILQQPSIKMETALALRGGFGTGKTKIGEVFGSLIRDHYLLVASPRYVTGQFNSHMASLLVLHADEAFWAGDKKSEGTLKDLVSGKAHMLEYKGIDPISIKNFIRLFVTGNPSWIIPAGFRDRRWAIFDMGEDHMQDHEYFAAIDHEMDNGGREALLHFLLNFDLTQVHLRTVPKTAALLDQQIESMTGEQAWWFQTLMRGELPRRPDGAAEGVVLKDDLYRLYIQQAQLQGAGHRSIETRIGMFLSDQLGAKLQNLRFTVGNRRLHCYGLPPLAECRQRFAAKLGQAVNWGMPEGEPQDWQHDPVWRDCFNQT